MAVQLTYTGTPFAEQIKQQGFKAGNPTGGFSTRLADLFQKGPKTFTTPNLGVASLYGKTIPVVSSTSNLKLPSGAIPGKTFFESLKNLGGTRFGTEVIQTPKQATKGMNLASRLGTKYTGPTASKLLAGKTVSGFGGAAGPGIIRSLFSLPMSLAMSGPYAMSKLMGPSVARGDFKADEAFQLGQSELGLGEFFTDQDFNQGYVSGALPAVVSGDPNQITGGITEALPPDAVLNEFDNITNTGVNQGERNIIDLIKSGGQKVLDFAAPIAKDVAGRSIASQALGKAGFMVGGIPGALAGMIFGGAKGGDLFNAPYIGGVTTVDEFGNLISGEELDKLNAAGGYYTDAARASRRRDARIANMRQRQALGKRISEANLARLEEQQAREEAARQAEAAAIQDANRAAETGGYQSSFASDTDFMEGDPTAGGQATTATMGSFKQGGIVGLL